MQYLCLDRPQGMSTSGIMRPLVGVTQRVDVFPDRHETRDALDQRLIEWILASGGVPVPVPNLSGTGHALDDWLVRIAPDAVILSGGNDLGQVACRDQIETCVLSWAESNRIPVLGLCRGMQMMGVHAGGQLVKIDGHVRTRHMLSHSQDWPGDVNSYHNCTFLNAPPGYHILARDADGAIEAMRHQALPWEGWMWHPERDLPFSLADIERWRWLMNHEES